MSDWNVSLSAALDEYIKGTPWLAPRTIQSYRFNFKTLSRGLEEILGKSIALCDVDSRTVAMYQVARSRQVSNYMVNKEIGALRIIMRWAGLWTSNVKRYRSLPPDQPKDEYIPTEEDIKKIVTVGVRKNKWE